MRSNASRSSRSNVASTSFLGRKRSGPLGPPSTLMVTRVPPASGSQRTSLVAQVHSMMLDDQRLTYVEGAVRRSVGSALVELGGAVETRGGSAARAQLVAEFGGALPNQVL